MSQRLTLRLLGSPVLELNDRIVATDQRKPLAMLAYLAVNRSAHRRDHLSALLWADYDQSKAFANLRHLLWEIRQLIGEGWIEAGRDSLGLSLARDVWLDAASFDSLLADARAQPDPSRRLPLLADAAKLYRGHFLSGFLLKDAPHFTEWAHATSEEYRCQFAYVLAALSNDLSALGQIEDAIPHAQKLVALDPLNEGSQRQLMQLYSQAGQQNAALKQYQACEKLLRRELGLDPQPETRALYKQIRKGELKFAVPAKEISKHNLPFPLSTFIGREKELAEIQNLVASRRLVTLTGAGGIGKTRLALKTGESQLGKFADGVWLAELASLDEPARVPQAIAEIFKILDQPETSPVESLARALRSKNILLVLDNCEHLLESCAQLANALLQECKDMKILATSREALGITGEAVYHVPPLGLPNVQQVLEKLRSFESVQLFEERARLVQESFALTMENAASVTEICRRLDGIPLAIELAAARVKTLGVEQIAARLDDCFKVLSGGSRAALPRQQTLRAAIDWSYNLLDDEERALFARLSVFSGGWTLGAAEQVCVQERGGFDVLGLLVQLADKSLVGMDDTQEEVRYYLLDTTRQYAREKLAEAGLEESFRHRHFEYFFRFAEEAEPHLRASSQLEWLDRLERDLNNLRAALEWTQQCARPDDGLRLAASLWWFWYLRSFLGEGFEWLSRGLDSQTAPALRARALYRAAHLGQYLGAPVAQRKAWLEESLELSRSLGDVENHYFALLFSTWLILDEKEAEPCYREALELAQRVAPWHAANVRMDIGNNAIDLGDFDKAVDALEQSVAEFRELGDRWGIAQTLISLAYARSVKKQTAPAVRHLDESIALFTELKFRVGIRMATLVRGELALQQKDYESARNYFEQTLAIARETGSRSATAVGLLHLGTTYYHLDDQPRAAQLLAESLSLLHSIGNTRTAPDLLGALAKVYAALYQFERAAKFFGAGEELGKGTPESLDAEDYARAQKSTLEALGEFQFARFYEEGKALTMEEAVAFARNAAGEM